MRMKIPQPIQLWFNKFNSWKYLSQSSNVVQRESAELTSFLHTQKSNPLLIIGLSNLIMETVSCYPPPDGAVEVLTLVCSQLLSFYRHKLEEVRTITLECIPALMYVYLYLIAHFTLPNCDGSSPPKVVSRTASQNELSETRDEDNSGEDDTETDHQVVALPSPLPRMRQYMARKIRKQSVFVHRSAKPEQKAEKTLDSFQIIGAIESLFLGVYNSSIARQLQDPETQERFSTSSVLETIYGDVLPNSKSSESIYVKELNTRRRSNETGASGGFVELGVFLNDNSLRHSYKFIKGGVVQSNRMRLLTYLLILLRDEIETVSDHVHGILCRLALMLHPHATYPQNRQLSTKEQTKARNKFGRSTVVKQKSSNLELLNEALSISGFSDSALIDGEVRASDKETLESSNIGGSENIEVNRLQNSVGKDKLPSLILMTKDNKLPRIQGLKPEFLTTLLQCIQRMTQPDSLHLFSSALDALEARANYEMWTSPLLLIQALRDLSTRPVSFGNRISLNECHVKTVSEQPLNIENHLKSTEFNHQQLSLASAYCGLWSDLVGKRDGLKNSPPKDEKQPDMVRLAQQKFMRSIVTNANFRTEKPPDDITITLDHARSSSQSYGPNQNKSPFALGNDQWDGNIEDLVIEETNVLKSPKSWIRRFGLSGQKSTKPRQLE